MTSNEVSSKGNNNPRGASLYNDRNDDAAAAPAVPAGKKGKFRLFSGDWCRDLVVYMVIYILLYVVDADTALYTELWKACAGPLVTVPRERELVYYFPQGHIEQVYFYLCWYYMCVYVCFQVDATLSVVS